MQASGDGQATGHGTAHVSDITNVMTLAGDLDIGQTAAGVMGHNTGMGTVTLERGPISRWAPTSMSADNG